MKMDSFLGSIDPFVVFECGNSQIKTITISDNKNPVWNLYLYVKDCLIVFLLAANNVALRE